MVGQAEKNNRRWGAFVSLGVHLALLLLFFFMLAWKEPNPPFPEYGIELNFGLDAAGSGEIQPSIQQVETELEAESESEPSEAQETIESEPEPPTEAVTEPIESEPEQTLDEAPPIDSPDTNPLEQPTEAQTETETDSEPESQPVEPVTDPQEPEVQPVASSVENDSDNQEAPTQSNQGDRTDEIGDQGDPQGNVDARALYGNPGGGDGAALDLTGWIWDSLPRPRDPSQESGRIVFQIIIDDQGDLISVRTVEKTVSPNIERIYKAEVEKLTFSPTTQNTLPAPRSTGTITFIIRSR